MKIIEKGPGMRKRSAKQVLMKYRFVDLDILFKIMPDNTEFHVKFQAGLIQSFRRNSSLKQGGSPALTLFNITLQYVNTAYNIRG